MMSMVTGVKRTVTVEKIVGGFWSTQMVGVRDVGWVRRERFWGEVLRRA